MRKITIVVENDAQEADVLAALIEAQNELSFPMDVSTGYAEDVFISEAALVQAYIGQNTNRMIALLGGREFYQIELAGKVIQREHLSDLETAFEDEYYSSDLKVEECDDGSVAMVKER